MASDGTTPDAISARPWKVTPNAVSVPAAVAASTRVWWVRLSKSSPTDTEMSRYALTNGSRFIAELRSLAPSVRIGLLPAIVTWSAFTAPADRDRRAEEGERLARRVGRQRRWCRRGRRAGRRW